MPNPECQGGFSRSGTPAQDELKQAVLRVALMTTYFFLFCGFAAIALDMLPPSTECEICLRNDGGPCDDGSSVAGYLLLVANVCLFFCALAASAPRLFGVGR